MMTLFCVLVLLTMPLPCRAMKKKGATPTNNSGNVDQLKSPGERTLDDDDTVSHYGVLLVMFSVLAPHTI